VLADALLRGKTSVRIGVNGGNGQVSIQDEGGLVANGQLIVGDSGTGTVSVQGGDYTEIERYFVEFGEAGDPFYTSYTRGLVDAKAGAIVGKSGGTGAVSVVGNGGLQVTGPSTVGHSGGTGTVTMVGNSFWHVFDGDAVISDEAAGSTGTLMVFGAALVTIEEGHSLQVNDRGSLIGDSRVKGKVATKLGSLVKPEGELAGAVVFTIEGDFDSGNGMTLAIDAPSSGVNDRLHATGAVSLGGVVDLNLGFTPVPWLADVTTPGSWIRVLSAGGSLGGDILANAPDPNTFGLPALASSEHHYEWKVVHDRDDGSPYQKLVQLNSAHSSQPWLGNETQDVVLLVMEVPPPEAYDDVYETPVDETLSQTEDGLLDNDLYLGEDGMTTVLLDGPEHGELTLGADGTFSYVPDEGFSGIDTFTYKATSGGYESEEATVTIVVSGTSISAADDGYYVLRGWLLDIDDGVLVNDSSSEPLTAILVSPPAHGSLTMLPDGSFEYMPAANFVGTDSFTYVATDGTSVSNLATATIEVDDYSITAVDDGETVPENSQFYSWYNFVLQNDYGSDPLSAELVSTTEHGTLTLYPEGGFFYEPDPDFVGVDYFTYRATDGVVWSNVATVELTVYEALTLGLPPVEGMAAALTSHDLAVIRSAALERWRNAGISRDVLNAALADVEFVITDLPGSHLGGAAGTSRILIDVDAAGHGWFIDATPGSDQEFARVVSRSERQAMRGSEAFGYVDLLTVLSHEIGHVLGLEHNDDPTNVMADELSLGTRRNPTAFDAAIVEWLYSTRRCYA
jgi:hypothetical protein